MLRILFGGFVVTVVVPAVLAVVLTLHRWSKYPEKSFYNNFLNVALTPMRWLKLGPFKQGKITLEKAMKYAMKKTKLSDFGDTTFVKNYELIADSPEMKALELTNIGYFSYRIEMNMTMVRRLKMIDYLKRNPEVLNVSVREPVFVFGMPRTGTTFLHRLLSLDPAVRAPLTWELLASVPDVDQNASKEDFAKDAQRRMKFMKKLIATRQSLGDNALSHIHEVGYDLPEECLLALTDDMPIHMSYIYILYMIFDRFMSIPSDDVVNAFKHYKNYLKLMSFQNFERDEATTKRWMLKCPVHLFYTKEIAKAFPDCKFVWTHRHPVSAIPSMASLGKSLHQVYYTSDCRDDAGLGKAVKHCYENFLSRCADDLEASGRPTSHVTYNNLVKDPVQTVKDVYAQFNWAFTPEYEQILKNFLAEDAAKRENLKKQKSTSAANLHHYSPEEFSLTAEELSTGAFADYIKRFNIPMSKN